MLNLQLKTDYSSQKKFVFSQNMMVYYEVSESGVASAFLG